MAKAKTDTMDLWNRVMTTNPKHTKPVKFGRAITAIDPYRQVESATREFGPAAQGWGWEIVQVKDLEVIKEIAILVRVWVGNRENFIEQWGQKSMFIDNANKKKDSDVMKKATTDGITKCLSYMGFNADVFLGKFDDCKYVQEVTEKFENDEELQEVREALEQQVIKSGEDIKELNAFLKSVDRDIQALNLPTAKKLLSGFPAMLATYRKQKEAKK